MFDPATDANAGNSVADQDPSTTTNSDSADTDEGGALDGKEDENRETVRSIRARRIQTTHPMTSLRVVPTMIAAPPTMASSVTSRRKRVFRGAAVQAALAAHLGWCALPATEPSASASTEALEVVGRPVARATPEEPAPGTGASGGGGTSGGYADFYDCSYAPDFRGSSPGASIGGILVLAGFWARRSRRRMKDDRSPLGRLSRCDKTKPSRSSRFVVRAKLYLASFSDSSFCRRASVTSSLLLLFSRPLPVAATAGTGRLLHPRTPALPP